jgi:hypothetical protein
MSVQRENPPSRPIFDARSEGARVHDARVEVKIPLTFPTAPRTSAHARSRKPPDISIGRTLR